MGWTDEGLEELHRIASLSDAQNAMEFITAFRKESLDDRYSKLRLRSPLRELPHTTNPDLILSLKYYLANTTVNAYNAIRDATMERHPEDYVYSYYRAKQAMSELSGVVPIVHDMCLAFTGSYDNHALLSPLWRRLMGY